MLYESHHAEILEEYCPRSEFSSRQSWASEGCNYNNDNDSSSAHSSFNTLIEIEETEQGTRIIRTNDTNSSSIDNNNITNFDNELLPFNITNNDDIIIIPPDATIMDNNVTTDDDNNAEIIR